MRPTRKLNRYLIAHASGDIEVYECHGEIPLDKLQELVGGYIEHARIDRTLSVMVNEDGIAMGLPPNPFCPALVGTIVFGSMELHLHDGDDEDIIFGPPPQNHYVIQTLEEILAIRDALRAHSDQRRSKQATN